MAGLINRTPAGGMGDYARATCDEIRRVYEKFTIIDHIWELKTSPLDLGYALCAVMEYALDYTPSGIAENSETAREIHESALLAESAHQYLCPDMPYVSEPESSGSSETVGGSEPPVTVAAEQQVCGLLSIGSNDAILSVFGAMTCDFGEDLMHEGMKQMTSSQSRGVEISFRGGKWSCGMGGALDPISCVSKTDPNARVEWGQE